MVLAFALLVPPIVHGCGRGSWVCTAGFALAGLLSLVVTVAGWNRFLLRGRLQAEVVRGNLAAGVASASHIAATGLIVAHCFAGDDLSALPISLGFFLLAQLSLVLLVSLFRALTDYADDQEIAGENLAAAISYAGVTLAVALIVAHAVDGPFAGWRSSLRGFGLSLLLALALYPVRQIVVARLVLGHPLVARGGALDRAIAQEQDQLSSWVEAVGYLAAAFLATGLAW
jgi:uncharacterized membrane protein YjfL (UPF0719 family)